MTKLGDDMAPLISVTDKLRPSLDRNRHRLEAFDKQAFVFVLRKDAQRGVRGQADADLLEVYARLAFATRPKVDRGNFTRSCDDGVGEIELAVKLERAGLNGERARGGPRLGGLVHDSHPGPELGQPEGEDKAGRTGADYQDIASFHLRLLNSGATKSKSGATKSKARRNKIKGRAQQKPNQPQQNPNADSSAFPSADRGFSMGYTRRARRSPLQGRRRPRRDRRHQA